MSEEKWAIITGADGGMGTEITRAVAEAGYHIIMACYRPSKAEPIRQRLVNETGNVNMEVMAVDLSSMASTASFADRIVERHLPVSLLMNNAGTMETGLHITDDGFERTVSVNYLGPYLLTRKLLPALTRGAPYCKHDFLHVRSDTSIFPDFFRQGKKGKFLANPCLQQYKTGFDAVYDRTFGTPP